MGSSLFMGNRSAQSQAEEEAPTNSATNNTSTSTSLFGRRRGGDRGGAPHRRVRRQRVECPRFCVGAPGHGAGVELRGGPRAWSLLCCSVRRL